MQALAPANSQSAEPVSEPSHPAVYVPDTGAVPASSAPHEPQRVSELQRKPLCVEVHKGSGQTSNEHNGNEHNGSEQIDNEQCIEVKLAGLQAMLSSGAVQQIADLLAALQPAAVAAAAEPSDDVPRTSLPARGDSTAVCERQVSIQCNVVVAAFGDHPSRPAPGSHANAELQSDAKFEAATALDVPAAVGTLVLSKLNLDMHSSAQKGIDSTIRDVLVVNQRCLGPAGECLSWVTDPVRDILPHAEGDQNGQTASRGRRGHQCCSGTSSSAATPSACQPFFHSTIVERYQPGSGSKTPPGHTPHMLQFASRCEGALCLCPCY